jgi:hypothetical protein
LLGFECCRCETIRIEPPESPYAPVAARLEEYLTSIGRRKLIVPLYRALIATPE